VEVTVAGVRLHYRAAGDPAAPTLVIGGGPTSHVPQDELARLAERLPAGRFVTIPAGHLIHTERPARFLAAVTPFLQLSRND
jgi:pimeloyl-ACP methyl ester carboxylesterase